jgi:TRAP-type mannitol/chloroaromatic compound transport system permease large subunit
MGWVEGSVFLFGGLVVAMGLGLPVAFAFLLLNVIGALLFLGGEPGLVQLARNAVASITSFSLTPIPFFVLMGEVLFHTGVALKAIDAFALSIRFCSTVAERGVPVSNLTISPSLCPVRTSNSFPLSASHRRTVVPPTVTIRCPLAT